VIAFGFRPEPGLAPPRPIPLDFVIFKPKMMRRELYSLWCGAAQHGFEAATKTLWGTRASARRDHNEAGRRDFVGNSVRRCRPERTAPSPLIVRMMPSLI
jgi:hypothetical protein